MSQEKIICTGYGKFILCKQEEQYVFENYNS